MTESLSCSRCGYDNAPGASFCGRCGQALPVSGGAATSARPAIFCPHCERKNPSGATFCGHCGRSLTSGHPPPVAAPPPAAPPPAAIRRRGLLPVVLLAGLFFLAAGVAYFLLPWFDENWPFGAAGLPEPSAASLSRANGDGADGAGEALVLSPTTDASGDQLVVEVSSDVTVTLAPTVTPYPTGTPRSTLTPLPTPTAPPPPTNTPQPPTPVPPPTNSPQPTSPPPVVCQTSPGDRWGPTLWDRYQETLGCATTNEIRTSAAYQYYQHGMMVWREDADRLYVLYNNGTFGSYRDGSPSGYFDSELLKGGFGFLWNNNSTVRAQIGQAQAAEFNATNFAAQDFAGGTIFYFFENDAHNYALFNGSGTWVSAQE